MLTVSRIESYIFLIFNLSSEKFTVAVLSDTIEKLIT